MRRDSLLGSGQPSAFPFYLFDQSVLKFTNFHLWYLGNAFVGSLEALNFRAVIRCHKGVEWIKDRK